MPLEPMGNRIVVRPHREQEEQTDSGLYIPDSAKEKPKQGTVVAVGPGRVTDQGERIPVGVEEGDVVLFGKYSGMEVEVDGHERLVMREDDIQGVIT